MIPYRTTFLLGTLYSMTYVIHIIASSEYNNVFFKKRSGIKWDNCFNPLQVKTLSECAVLCSVKNDTCLGFNFEKGKLTSPRCCTRSSDHREAITQTSASESVSMSLYFAFDTVVYKIPSKHEYSIVFPDGLYENQVILLRAQPMTGLDKLNIVFVERKPFLRGSDAERGECDLLFEINFIHPTRPNEAVLNTYDGRIKDWRKSWVTKKLGDFITFGTESDVVIVVTELKYTIYINGRLFEEFTRRSNLASIEEVKAIEISATYHLVYVKRDK